MAFGSGAMAFGSGARALAAGAGNVGSSVAGAKESGQLGITWAGVEGSARSEGGGHAGIALSAGGLGGQTSVSCGAAGSHSPAVAHPGVVPADSPLADDCVLDQSGSPFCIGRAGSASS